MYLWDGLIETNGSHLRSCHIMNARSGRYTFSISSSIGSDTIIFNNLTVNDIVLNIVF